MYLAFSCFSSLFFCQNAEPETSFRCNETKTTLQQREQQKQQLWQSQPKQKKRNDDELLFSLEFNARHFIKTFYATLAISANVYVCINFFFLFHNVCVPCGF